MKARIAIAALFLTLVAARSAHADEDCDRRAEEEPRDDVDHVTVTAHADLVPFAHGGYDVWAGVKPPGTSHWQFGAGVYRFEQPSGLARLTGNAGVTVESFVATSFVSYYFGVDPLPYVHHRMHNLRPSERGLFAGALLGYGHVTGTESDLTKAYSEIVVGAQAGYTWYPLARGLYLSPAVGASTSIAVASRDGGGHYTRPPVEPLVFINLGVQF